MTHEGKATLTLFGFILVVVAVAALVLTVLVKEVSKEARPAVAKFIKDNCK